MNLGDYIGQQVQKAMGSALNAWWGDPAGDLSTATEAGADQLASDMIPGQGGIIGFLGKLPLVGGAIGDLINPIQAIFGKGVGLVEGLAVGWGLGSVISQVMDPAFASAVYSAHRAAGDGRIDPTTGARLRALGIMTAAQADADGSDQGMDTGRMQQLFEAALSFPDVAALLDLYNRGTIQLQDVEFALQRHGFNPTWAGYLVTLSQNLLSPADLALGWLRGDLSDAELNAYAVKLGVDAADMRTLIANTGEPPGGEEMMSMWRRGIIDRPRFERGIRQSRVRDEWIQYLEAAIYQPMSISDAVRGVVENYLDDREGQIIAAQNGLRPDHWPILRESWGRPLSRTEMGALYHRGQASRDQFDQAMRESDLKDKYLPQAFELARTLLPQRQVVAALQHGVIDHPTAVQKLMQEGYEQADAEILVNLGAAEHHASLKELSKTDIAALFTERLIDRPRAIDKLAFLGYDRQTADLILTLAQSRKQAALARTLTSQTRALYLHKDLDRQEARRKLEEGGVAPQDSEALVDEWDLVKSVPSRALTESMIVKAAKDGIVSVVTAADRLVALGYSESDATVLLQEAGLVSYEPTFGEHWTPPKPGELFGGH